MKYQFDEFILDTGSREVTRNGDIVDLEPRAYELLVYLLERKDDAVSKDELQDGVWKTIVSDGALTRCVMKLRRALGDRDERIIKTVPRFGYRFNTAVAPLENTVEQIEPEPAQTAATEPGIAPAGGLSRAVKLALIAAAAVVVIGALLWGLTSSTPSGTSEIPVKSVAVLPFDDMSETQDQAWFADGLAEELLNSLARTPDLLVAARTSSFAYRDSALDVPEIATELGVAHVLEGSVRRDGDHLRVTAQLIRSTDGFHLWSETYDHTFANLITLQEEIATDIANALHTAMDPEALQQMISAGTRSVAAFEAYLEGLAGFSRLMETGDAGAYHDSLAAHQRAVAEDPKFASAYAEIADYWATQLSFTGIAATIVETPREELLQNYREAMDLAILHSKNDVDRLSLRSRDAWSTMRLKDAIELNTQYLQQRPNDWEAQARQIDILSALNRYDELVETSDRYLQSRPTNARVVARIVHTSLYSGDRQAIERAIAVGQRHTDSTIANYQIHRALLWLGRKEEASIVLRRLQASDMPPRTIMMARLRQHCSQQEFDAAEALYAEIMRQFGNSPPRVWLSSNIMGDHVAASAALAPLDDIDKTAFVSFLEYGSFDPRPFPGLVQYLKIHGNEEGAEPVPIPYRCYLDGRPDR